MYSINNSEWPYDKIYLKIKKNMIEFKLLQNAYFLSEKSMDSFGGWLDFWSLTV